jgi:hypothetical protein
MVMDKEQHKEISNIVETIRLLQIDNERKKILGNIKQRASDYFDYILLLSDAKLDSENQKLYKKTKSIFVKTVLIQCYKEGILNDENIIPFKMGLLTGLLPLKEMTDKKINDIIYLYAAPNIFFMSILKPQQIKVKFELQRIRKMLDEAKKKSQRNLKKPGDKTFDECKMILELISSGNTFYKALQITAIKFNEVDTGNLKTRFYNFCRTRTIDYKNKESIIEWLKTL